MEEWQTWQGFESSIVHQPFTHTLFFIDSLTVEDNSSQFFENPPEMSSFRVKGNEIFIGESNSVYNLNDDWTQIKNKETGAVLGLE